MKRYYSSENLVFTILCLFLSLPLLAQETIKGTVLDKNGKVVLGASIAPAEQPDQKTVTDKNGKFSISPHQGGFLRIDDPGRYSKETKIGADNFVIRFDRNDEIIPVGFGIEYVRKDLTSAVGSVNGSKLAKNMAMNPANSLFGMIPGLAVMQNGGTAWENNPDIFIRGVGTFGNATPLVLVDGFERPLSSLSLFEIETVTVLKDAATLAMYGQKGANGVLMITTKRGSFLSSRVYAQYETGVTRAFRLPQFLDGYGYAQSFNQARLNDGLSPFYSPDDIQQIRSKNSPYLYPNVDWFKEAFREMGTTSNLNVSFDGNSKYVKHFTTLNYQKDNGLFGPVNDNEGYETQLAYNRLNFRTNLDVDVTSSTRFKVNLSGNLSQTNTPGRSTAEIINALYTVPSAAFPVKTYNNEWGGTSIYSNNPVAMISGTGFISRQNRELLADMSLEQGLDQFIPGLKASASVAYDNSASYRDAKTRRFRYEEVRALKDDFGKIVDTVESRYGNNTELAYSSSLENQWRHATFRGKLSYSKVRNKNSLHSALVLQQDKLVGNGQYNTYLQQLVAGTVQYALDGKYFINASASYGGTNILPKDSRFGFFPALSAAWKISDEAWFGNLSWINQLKLRGSWGMAGNDRIPQNIAQQQFYGSGVYHFTPNNVAAGGIMEGRLGSPGLSGEVAYKSNIGLDLDLAKGFDLTLDLFHERRTRLLVESTGTNSTVVGVLTPYQNAGITTNKGLELGFNVYNARTAPLTYHFNGQFSFARNKIVEMNEKFQPFSYQRKTGGKIDQAFGLEAIGFFADETDVASSPRQLFSDVGPGDIKYRDQNADGVIDEYDEKQLGYSLSHPELYFSGSFSLNYKGFEFSALLQGAANQTLYLNTAGVFWPIRGNGTISTFSENSWTPATAGTATLPRLSTMESINNYRPNTIWLKNGAFVKLRSIALSYDLPEKLVSKWKCISTRIYIRGNNLFSIDNVKDSDPENIGINYPTLSSYNLGIQIGF